MEKMTVFWRLRSQYAFSAAAIAAGPMRCRRRSGMGRMRVHSAAVYPGRCADGSFGIRYENPSFRFPMCVL